MKFSVIFLSVFMISVSVITSCKSKEVATSSPEQQRQSKPQGGPPSTEDILAQMDVNKDGKLSLEEVKGPLKNDFNKIDTNSDGFISTAELEAAPKPNRQRPPGGGGRP